MTETDEVTKKEMQCFLIPCGARVVVQEDPFKESSRLIVTPDNVKRRPTTGTIIAVGPDVPFLEEGNRTILEVGDRILFGMYSGTLVQFKQRPAYRVLTVEEVLCKIDATVEEASLDFSAA